MSYDESTYDSTTYDTGEVVHGRGGGPVGIFVWGGLVKPKEEEEKKQDEIIEDLIEFEAPPIPVIKAELVEFTAPITVILRQEVTAEATISVISAYEQKLQALDALINALAYEKQTLNKERQKERWRLEQATTNREYWAKAGYCYCFKFSGVHSVKDCQSEGLK
jgi:hypothetical protein